MEEEKPYRIIFRKINEDDSYSNREVVKIEKFPTVLDAKIRMVELLRHKGYYRLNGCFFNPREHVELDFNFYI